MVYRPKTGAKLRWLFRLVSGSLSIPGMLFEREETGRERFFWSFAGKFPWEVRDGFVPFAFMHQEHDLGPLLFYAIPQMLLDRLYGVAPKTVENYTRGEARTCSTCIFARYQRDQWETWRERSSFERYLSPPASLFTCAVSGDRIDHAPIQTPSYQIFEVLRQSLRKNSCPAHTRRPYCVDTSLEARETTGPTRWVGAEYRRLMALNPASWSWNHDRSRAFLPDGLVVHLEQE